VKVNRLGTGENTTPGKSMMLKFDGVDYLILREDEVLAGIDDATR